MASRKQRGSRSARRGRTASTPTLSASEVARVEPFQVSGISAGYVVTHPVTGERKRFKTSLGANHYAERTNLKLHGQKWPHYSR